MLSFYSRVLVAHDGSELSERALDMALALLKQDEKIELDVVAVSNLPTAAAMGSYGIYSQDMIQELREGAKKILDAVQKKVEGLPNKIRTDLLEGSPGKMVVEYAKENDCDLIVMGSRGLSGIKEVFLGSVSHYVVQRSHCPVFIVK